MSSFICHFLGLSIAILKTIEHLETPAKSALRNRVLLTVLVAYSTRLLSCGIHELLGHGLWAWIFGANEIQVYISWLGFGWCKWQGASSSYTAQVMIMAGGLLNTFIIGAVLLAFLFLVSRKGGFYLRFSMFWLGFWAVITQAGYLVLGGLTSEGNPSALHRLTGVPLNFFIFLGFSLFLIAYFAVSVLFLSEIAVLFPEYSQKVLLFEFWLTIPIQIIFLMTSPEHTMSTGQFISLFSISMVPSLLSILLFRLIRLTKSKIENKTKVETID